MVESTQAKSLGDAKNPVEGAEKTETKPEPAEPQTLQASSDDDKELSSKKKHKIGK